MGLSTISTNDTPVNVSVPGPSILLENANSVIIVYGPFKRAGYKINWKEGTTTNPEDGGTMTTPTGDVIPLTFKNDLWHLPIYSVPTKTVRPRTLAARTTLTCSANSFDALTDCDREPTWYTVKPPTWTTADIQTSHEEWCHPGHSKYDQIQGEYPGLFPKDSRYRTAARNHQCPVCALMKGSRTYRKSKKMKEKKVRRGDAAQHKLSAAASIAQQGATVCPSHAPQPRVCFSASTVSTPQLHQDDFLKAFNATGEHVLHIDHAHTIS